MTRSRIIAVVLLAIGIVNLAPGIVAIAPHRAASLYGIAIDTDPTLALLMRHRAVLLALVGAALVVAAIAPAHRPLMICAALVSKVAFVTLWAVIPGTTEAVRSVALVDAVAAPILLATLWFGRAGGTKLVFV